MVTCEVKGQGDTKSPVVHQDHREDRLRIFTNLAEAGMEGQGLPERAMSYAVVHGVLPYTALPRMGTRLLQLTKCK